MVRYKAWTENKFFCLFVCLSLNKVQSRTLEHLGKAWGTITKTNLKKHTSTPSSLEAKCTPKKLKDHFENKSDLNGEKILLDIYTVKNWVMCWKWKDPTLSVNWSETFTRVTYWRSFCRAKAVPILFLLAQNIRYWSWRCVWGFLRPCPALLQWLPVSWNLLRALQTVLRDTGNLLAVAFTDVPFWGSCPDITSFHQEWHWP